MKALKAAVLIGVLLVAATGQARRPRPQPNAGLDLHKIPPRMRPMVNLRDAGKLSGLPLGRVFRSDDPRTRPYRTCERLRKLGIRTIVKLNAHQSRLDFNFRPRWRRGACGLQELAVALPYGRTRGAARMNINKLTARVGTRRRRRVQRYMKTQIRLMLLHLARLKNRQFPVLIHCSLGRDRTGVVVALLQLLAGADRPAVERDYLESGRNVGGTSVHAARRIARRLSPADRYLRSELRLDRRTVTRLKRLFHGPGRRLVRTPAARSSTTKPETGGPPPAR